MKEAVVKLHTYMRFNPEEITDQKALDSLEEILNELDEKYGITINIHERKIQEV
jgi:hypothetical protein